MVDDFDGEAAGRWAAEGAGFVSVEGFPGFLVDFGLQAGLERLVGIVRAKEIGVADEEALFVVVGVDEPAGNAIGPVAADFAGIGMEHVHAVDLDPDLAGLAVVTLIENFDVRLAEDDKPQRVAFRYILALVLLRKRTLRLIGREEEEDGEIWLLRFKGTDGDPIRVKNPGIAEEEIHHLSDQLGEILQGDF